jgi:16S rRNA (adenine1518-N6/adenine1519-N6)-dimethyltransferase
MRSGRRIENSCSSHPPSSLTVPQAGQIREMLRRYGVRPRKSLGQHFLVDPQLPDLILRAAELEGKETVIEVGAGLGVLTRLLCQAAGLVVAVEVDPVLFGILQQELRGTPNLVLVQSDVLKVDFDSSLPWLRAGERAKVVANLPYYLSSPLLFHLLRFRHLFSRWVLTVQKEVADRLRAVPGSKQYGSLSVAIQLNADVELIAAVPRGAFYPPPQVDSAVVRVTMREEPRLRIEDESLFFRIVRAAFAQRRKMLKNALADLLGPQGGSGERERAWTETGVSPRRRGETLSIEEFARLANYLYQEREEHVPHR